MSWLKCENCKYKKQNGKCRNAFTRYFMVTTSRDHLCSKFQVNFNKL